VCDLETSRMGAPYIYIYIYDIRSLRVNDLTFILLTWRKWLAPNNASRQQMGCNSGFKGLMPIRVSDVSVQLCRILQIAQYCDLYRQACIVTFVKFTPQCSRQIDGDSKTMAAYRVEWRNFLVKCVLGE